MTFIRILTIFLCGFVMSGFVMAATFYDMLLAQLVFSLLSGALVVCFWYRYDVVKR